MGPMKGRYTRGCVCDSEKWRSDIRRAVCLPGITDLCVTCHNRLLHGLHIHAARHVSLHIKPFSSHYFKLVYNIMCRERNLLSPFQLLQTFALF